MRHITYATIADRKVKLSPMGDGPDRLFEPTDAGAAEAGEFLAGFPMEKVGMLNSSTIDFPEDEGLEGFDAHRFLNKAMGKALTLRHNRGDVTTGELVELGYLSFEDGKKIENGHSVSFEVE